MALSSNTKKLFIRILLFLLYLLLGAAIFFSIEQRNEKKEREKNKFKTQYEKFTERYNISKPDMLLFIEELQKAVKLGYNTTTEKWPDYYHWSFMNAFHFAGNVVTTIGYGHIAPVTLIGKIICIVYALLGIPLTGLTLRSIGNRISEFIAVNIKALDRKFYNRETEKLEIKTAVVAFGCLLVIIFIPAAGFSVIENWEYMDAVYFCFITLTTIGFGDYVPGIARQKYDESIEVVLEFLNLFYMVLGLAVMSGVIVSISGVIEEKTKNLGVVDPLEALRSIRVENLNSRALKKLGYKMGPGGPQGAGGPQINDMSRDPMQRLPPKLAAKTNQTVNSGAIARSRSAETMEFQGPTPVMYLNKQQTTNNNPGSTDAANAGSPVKIFNNKIAPAEVTQTTNVDNTDKFDGPRKPSENNSTSTESAEEARASDEDNEFAKVTNGSIDVREEAELDGSGHYSDDPKNNLVVQVQVTPMPSPRESPVPTRSSLDSIPLTQIKSADTDSQLKCNDEDSEKIETYEGGSIDSSSHPFNMDRTDSTEDVRMGDSMESSVSKDLSSSLQSSELSNAQNTHHKPRTKETATTQSKTKNGFISRNNQTRPMLKGKPSSRSFVKPAEHIDLGDKSTTKR